MQQRLIAAVLASSGFLCAQDGQKGARANWPCVAGRAVDPAYLEISESTGGQLFLFQKGEAVHSEPVMSASFTHPATVFRAVGRLNGEREFVFPVDSTIESMLVLASVQCRNGIVVTRPSGREATAADSAADVGLAAGRILRITAPEPGKWRVALRGSGLFVLSVLAKSEIAALDGRASGSPLSIQLRVSGEVAGLRTQLVDAAGEPVSEIATPERGEDGAYRFSGETRSERYRVVVTGQDRNAWPFERMCPTLFRTR